MSVCVSGDSRSVEDDGGDDQKHQRILKTQHSSLDHSNQSGYSVQVDPLTCWCHDEESFDILLNDWSVIIDALLH